MTELIVLSGIAIGMVGFFIRLIVSMPVSRTDVWGW